MTGRATHGHTRNRKTTPEFRTWRAMIQRCTDPGSERFQRYGGRGIAVCNRWLNSFEHFLADMGPRPTGMTIDRIDNDGDYEPGNCRWVDDIEQANKKSSNRIVEYGGQKKTVAEWARAVGISYAALQSRLDRGWPLDIALNPDATRRGQAKMSRAAAMAENMVCQECGTTFIRKTKRSRCCSNECRKRLTKREYHHANKDRINQARRRASGGITTRKHPMTEAVQPFIQDTPPPAPLGGQQPHITPTVGRVVHFWPFPGDMVHHADQPLAAIVTYVWNDYAVNLCVFDANGVPHGRTSIVLVQPGQPAPQAGYCEWMPYQKQVASGAIPPTLHAVASPFTPEGGGNIGQTETTGPGTDDADAEGLMSEMAGSPQNGQYPPPPAE